METINERLMKLRTDLRINQEKFGEKINLTKFAISNYETGKRELPDRTISDVCREFNVSENWLRTGKGEMFIPSGTFSLDEYAKKNNLTPLELDIVKGYMSLDPVARQSVLSYFKKIFNKPDETMATKEGKVYL